MSSVHVVVYVESELGFHPLGSSTIAETALARAASADCSPKLSLWVAAGVTVPATVRDRARAHFTIATDVDLATYASQCDAEFVLLHDAQRPLTQPDTFDRVVDALVAGAVAARPSHVVVDTLKVVDNDFRITGTVNRDEVMSLTSPEGYKKSALNGEAGDVWLLNFAGEHDYVRGDLESLRVRVPEDVLLVESFLIWQVIEAKAEAEQS